MADPRDARIAELERQLAASEARVEILRQVKALLEVFLANQRRRKLPISCGMECIAGRTW